MYYGNSSICEDIVCSSSDTPLVMKFHYRPMRVGEVLKCTA